ncbi:hypothetical protein EDB81DRAFT_860164 [Dactylonectria macrodidyma]|uniref:DUF7708 domain-containing protein n=1 Tax=Dactylonectria macrodidyma TaxID=307937 RepID=A0A9P9DZG1_9HYPO|nr:hypothetical protein EDB81DRAFT_860164 [Dactylonectria macrodidyma]
MILGPETNMQFAPFIDPEPSALVQRYSWEIETIPRTEPDTKEFSQLRADFIGDRDRKAAERQDEIRRIEAHLFAARPGDEESLLKTQQQLFGSMKDFQKFVPGHSATAAPLTSWADVEKVVQDVQAQWDTKTNETHLGKTKNCLRKMCNGLNNHSTTLKLLPSESMYTSLIAGSVSMIIKAFAQGIVVINDAVSMVQRSQVYDTPALKQLAMRLYSHVLTYLTQFMAWFTHRSRTRFLKSFNENIQQNFQAGLDRVKEVAELLCRHIQLHMSADGRISKLMLEETSGNVKHLLHLQEAGQVQARIQTEATANLVENMVHSQFQKSREELREDMRSLANTLHEMLRQEISATGMTNLLVHQAALSRAPSPGGLERHGRSGSDSSVSSSRTGECITTIDSLPQRGAVIQFESRHFEEFFDWDQVHLSDESPQPVLADPAFVTRLKSFTETMESRIMYAHSRYQGIESKSLIDAVGSYLLFLPTIIRRSATEQDERVHGAISLALWHDSASNQFVACGIRYRLAKIRRGETGES